MVRIDTEIKLDFKDVLIRPKRSTLKSRSQVCLSRTLKMKHTNTSWTGVPIIAANMDTTGTFDMAVALSKYKMITALHKHYSSDEIIEFCQKEKEAIPYIAISSGTSNEDFDKMKDVIKAVPAIKMLCLDIANGYSEHFAEYVKKVRTCFPSDDLYSATFPLCFSIAFLLLIP